MIAADTYKITRVGQSRLPGTDLTNIDFGKIVSDHMLVASYSQGHWNAPVIVPYGDITLSPTALSLHYGQTVFEGLKAFKTKDGGIALFRLDKHYSRLCKSLERLCMPQVPYGHFVEGIKQLVALDAAWVPGNEGASLYIRPFVFASNQERFGVHESDDYRFMIFTGPVGPYYARPLKVKVEDRFMRATHGGTGFAKCGGNYGASFYPAKLAKEQGFDQVLWTDGTPELNIEESGTMNVMFVISGTVVTPPLSDTILDGVTRDSFLALAAELGYKTEERKIGANELAEAASKGLLHEAFGVGTAAVTAPISTIHIKGTDHQVPAIGEDSFMAKAKNLLNAIRTGRVADIHGWNTVITAQ